MNLGCDVIRLNGHFLTTIDLTRNLPDIITAVKNPWVLNVITLQLIHLNIEKILWNSEVISYQLRHRLPWFKQSWKE